MLNVLSTTNGANITSQILASSISRHISFISSNIHCQMFFNHGPTPEEKKEEHQVSFM